jgi:hypothetical protein
MGRPRLFLKITYYNMGERVKVERVRGKYQWDEEGEWRG